MHNSAICSRVYTTPLHRSLARSLLATGYSSRDFGRNTIKLITERPATNDTNRVRTGDPALKGPRLNHLTMVPFLYIYILTDFSYGKNL